MKKLLLFCSLLLATNTFAGVKGLELGTEDEIRPVNVITEKENFKGKASLKVYADPEVTDSIKEKTSKLIQDFQARGKQPTPADLEHLSTSHLVVFDTIEFSKGTIEAEIVGSLSSNAPGQARGFVGIAWNVQDDKTYDCIYLRPTNGRANDQQRRNHSVQYISHPEWTWYRLRKEMPSKYEAYADILPDEWIKVKIVVEDQSAKLYVNEVEQPTLIVNDLKTGREAGGRVALWIHSSTVGRFRNVKISQ
jgi:hypothetical protein